jgi:hypothetical protein
VTARDRIRCFCAGVALVLLIAGCGASSVTPAATPPPPTPPPFVPGKLSVSVLRSTGPRVLSVKVPVMTIHLAVRGLHLDARHMGGKSVAGHGHIQVYIDRIPTNAYKTMDLKGVVANVATPLFSVGFTPKMLKSEAGKHRLMVTLAKNNYVLYHTPPRVISVVFK